jgi:hypothetical protein
MQEKIVAVKAEAGPVTIVLRDARMRQRDLKYGVETLAFAKETKSDERPHSSSSRFVAAVMLAFMRLWKAT